MDSSLLSIEFRNTLYLLLYKFDNENNFHKGAIVIGITIDNVLLLLVRTLRSPLNQME